MNFYIKIILLLVVWKKCLCKGQDINSESNTIREKRSWKTSCLIDLISTKQIKQIAIVFMDENSPAILDVLHQLYEHEIPVALLHLISRNNSDKLEDFSKHGLKYVALIDDLNEQIYISWRTMFQQFCGRIFWIIFQPIVNSTMFYHNSFPDGCRILSWIIAVRRKLANESTRKYNLYRPKFIRNSFNKVQLTKKTQFSTLSAHDINLDLRGVLLRVSKNGHLPYVDVDFAQTEEGVVIGTDAELINYLKLKFGFRLKYVDPNDGEWGKPIGNGRWSGMIGMIQRQEADLAIGGIAMQYQRLEVVDFSNFFTIAPRTLISRSPEQKSKLFVIIQPFSSLVWLLVLVSFVIAFLHLRISLFVRNIFFENIPRINSEQTIWFLLGSFLKQGFIIRNLVGTSTSIFVAFWFIYVLVTSTAYSGNLVSFLAFMDREKAIDNFDDLAEAILKRNFKCGGQKGSTATMDLMSFSSGPLKVISDQVGSDDSVHFTTKHQGLSRIFQERYVMFDRPTSVVVPAKIAKIDCFLHFGNEFLPDVVGVAFQKKFPYQREFNVLIRRATETGLVSHWTEAVIDKVAFGRAIIRKSEISQETNNSYLLDKIEEDEGTRSIKLRELKSLFVLFLSGCILSILIFAFEYIYNKPRVFSAKSSRVSVDAIGIRNRTATAGTKQVTTVVPNNTDLTTNAYMQ